MTILAPVRRRLPIAALAASALAAAACGGARDVATDGEDRRWHSGPDGVVVELGRDGFERLRVQVVGERAMRVTAATTTLSDTGPDTLMVVADAAAGGWDVQEADGRLRVSTAGMAAEIELANGRVSFFDGDGRLLLAEAGRSRGADADGYAVRQQFERQPGESVYGLGQRQDGLVDLTGHNVELTTHNIVISIPFLTSSRGYGILWNSAAVSRLGDPAPARPLAEGFTLYDASGIPGGLTARYFDGDELLFEQVVADLDHQFLARGNDKEHPFPGAAADAADLRIEWSGSVEPAQSGDYTLSMYSSGYARLAIDGETVLDRWRMNWNPWYHDTGIAMQAGRRYAVRVDWRTQGGYFRLLQHAPLPAAESGRLSLAADTGTAVDYYVVAGDGADDVVAGYRRLTGKATMLPKWAFGFWQSRERYKSGDELLGVLEEYRKRGIPIDNIVLDWSYWPVDAWGSHDFDPEFFPDPAGLVERVHELDARIMISVWPKFYPATAHYEELDARGCMFNKNIEERNLDWIGPGYLNAFYDAFDAGCRGIYWNQVRDSLDVHGFDAWWLDAVEPDMHSNLSFEHRKDMLTPNALGTGAELFNAYALPHAESVHRGDRAADPGKRSFILTRSGFGGIQRTGAAIWSGDIVTRWSNLEEQIAAGVSVGLSGMPYWTFDIGGFTPEDHYRWTAAGAVGHYSGMPAEHRDEWQEINLRWFQFGAFAPLFRSHGQNPYREIFNLADAGSTVYGSLVRYTKLRYRLMPYIYTLAGDAYHRDGTMMRGLNMDFPDDPAARDVRTQYLFGPALLVNPVFESGARARSVYLPAGTDWYDFDTGARHAGGQTIEAAAPLERMPLFVRAGAILPTGPSIRHTGESLNAPLTLHVYTGADGAFDIYEDDGLSYAYEDGAWSRIPVRYDDATGTVTLGERIGAFEGMAGERSVAVRWVDGPSAPPDADPPPDVLAVYTGAPLGIERPQ
ncbi:MAG TPA: TIM-barrel domain-containing protein [Woeseiaceae bacterium]|nr:TIM-barrel domain-containing protein [Woeseiaceae bacterium]